MACEVLSMRTSQTQYWKSTCFAISVIIVGAIQSLWDPEAKQAHLPRNVHTPELQSPHLQARDHP